MSSEGTVPLSQVVEMREIVGPRQITRENRMVLVTYLNQLVRQGVGVDAARAAGDLQVVYGGFGRGGAGQVTVGLSAGRDTWLQTGWPWPGS